MLFSVAVEGCLINRTGNRRGDLSPKTSRCYKYLYRTLARYLGDPPLEQIVHADLVNFMRYLEVDYRKRDDEPLSQYAQDNFWKAIMSFWNWAVDNLHVEPIHLGLRRPRIVPEPVIPFSEEDIKRLIKGCAKTGHDTRNRAIIYTFLDTGLRLGELTRLKVSDVLLDYSKLIVRPYYSGKKSKPREVPFGREVKKWLWQIIHTEDLQERQPVFGLTDRGVMSVMMRLENKTGVQNVHAHRFRHTFAIQYLRNGGDIYTLQSILGHSSIEMCRRYLNIVQVDVQRAHAIASPVENWNI